MSDHFHYQSGEPVQVGDVVSFGRSDATVEMVILPGTQEAIVYSCLEGGVLLLTSKYGRVLETPPDGASWEDLEFVRRSETC